MAYNYEYPYTDPTRYNSDWLLEKVKGLVKDVHDLEEWKETHSEEYEELREIIDNIIHGKYPEEMEKSLIKWVQENAIDIVGDMVKCVFFGLTDNGYFVAYIPEGWDDIIFNTSGLDIDIPDLDYGRLILSY